ncbi:MAG TPA: DUF4267 domain-containing protein [Terracidiphilus sp.]|nr:DUF4267 domain-containing protein [Terracidiphilus sp.]
MMNPAQTARSRWVPVVVVLGALLLATGAVIALARPAMLLSSYEAITPAVRTYADYFAVRNLAMALLLLALLVMGARRALGNGLILVGWVQLLDAAMDCAEGRCTLVPGVTLLGILFLLTAFKLCGAPFWRRAAWIP